MDDQWTDDDDDVFCARLPRLEELHQFIETMEYDEKKNNSNDNSLTRIRHSSNCYRIRQPYFVWT